MSSGSTANFIAYDLRPAKQTERRILLDYLEGLKEAGIQVSSARYIGMGGTKFYDFAMIHRYLGVADLVSCERSAKTWKRSVYNRPFARIEVRNEEVGKYLKRALKEKLAVCWLDYDDGLSPDIISDIQVVGQESTVGTSIFVTVASGLPRDYIELSEQQRLEEIKSEFTAFAADVSIDDVQEAKFANVYYKIILKAFENSFPTGGPATFTPYFRVIYKDSVKMLTIGGTYMPQAQHIAFQKIMKRRLPFLLNSASPYKIRGFNITERERHLFEFASSARRNSAEANTLRNLGFKQADLEGYRDLVRFMPRYVEAYN